MRWQLTALKTMRAVNFWLLGEEGSTRPLGLFRIILVMLLWARLADELAFWNVRSLDDAITGAAFFILTPLALVGWHTRRVMTLLSAVMALVYFHLGQNLGHLPFTHHHVYLLFMSTLLCALGPCDRSFSLDRWITVRAGREQIEQGPLTANRLLILQLAAVYFWTAFDKTNWIFLSGVRLNQILHLHYSDTFFEPFLLWPPLVISLSVVVVVVEYFLAVAVLLRRWLILVCVLGVMLHGMFYLLLPVQTFSVTMLAIYLMLFNPQSVHDACDRVLAVRGGVNRSRMP